MRKRILHIFLFILLSAHVNAQEYLIRQFPLLDTVEKKYGPNLQNYNAMIYGMGVLGGPTDSSGSNIRTGQSFYVTYGGRYKTKISSFYNLGIDYFMEYRNFSIAQTSSKVFADNIEHKKERFSQITFNLGIFNRFNFSKRGNHLGKYIDLFVNGIFSPVNRYYVYDKLAAGGGSRYSKQVFSRLEFANKFFAQAGLRYGVSFFQIQAFYRPFNMFKKSDKFPFPELPRFGFGIMIDIEDLYKNK